MRKRKPVRHKHVREVERELGVVLGMDIVNHKYRMHN